MKRKPTWRSELFAVVHRGRTEPFAWGVNDCALKVADCVLAMTGEDLAAPFRSTYSTAAGAVRALKRQGFDDLLALVAHHLSPVEPDGHPAHAQTGDIAAVKTAETGWALGIVLGDRVQVMGQDGTYSIDLLAAERAFRVG